MKLTRYELECGAENEKSRADAMRKRASELRKSADDMDEWAAAADARATDYARMAASLP